MNLAEIRKKAQTAEPAQRAAAPPAAFSTPPAEARAEAPAGADPEPAAPLPGAPSGSPLTGAGDPPLFREPEAAPWEFPAGDEFHLAPGLFDPAAVILKGRESASFQEVTSREEQEVASVELLCFRVAGEEYAIDIMEIKEIIKPREVTEVPRVPPFVRGILSLRGNIIPIFDMRLRLGLADSRAGERERVIVVKRQNGFCGIVVDEVVQVVRIAQAGIEPPPVVLEGIDRDFVRGIGRVSGRMLILLDIDKVLDVNLGLAA